MTSDATQQTILHSPVWGFVGVIVSIVALFISFYWFWLPREENRIAEQLEDERDLQYWKEQYLRNPGARHVFRSAIHRFLQFTEKWFGSSFSSTFKLCFVMALLYPFLFALVQWVVFNEGTIGSIAVFKNIPEFGWRLYYTVGFVLLLAAARICFRNLDKIIDKIAKLFLRLFPEIIKTRYPAIGRRVAVAVVVTGAVAVVVVVTGAVAGAVAFAGAFAVVGVFAVAVAVAVAFAVAFAVAGAGAVVVVIPSYFQNAEIPGDDWINLLMLWFFLLFMPLVNAALDAASWRLTGYLMNNTLNAKTGIKGLLWTLLELSLDLFAAFMFMVMLAVLIPFSCQVLNLLVAFMGGTEAIDWREMVETARNFPFTSGLMVAAMLLTTLVPTAIHLAAVIVAFVVIWFPQYRQIANSLNRIGGKNPLSAREQQALVSALVWTKLWVLPALVVSLPLVLAIGYFLVLPFGTSLTDILVQAAYWGGNLV